MFIHELYKNGEIQDKLELPLEKYQENRPQKIKDILGNKFTSRYDPTYVAAKNMDLDKLLKILENTDDDVLKELIEAVRKNPNALEVENIYNDTSEKILHELKKAENAESADKIKAHILNAIKEANKGIKKLKSASIVFKTFEEQLEEGSAEAMKYMFKISFRKLEAETLKINMEDLKYFLDEGLTKGDYPQNPEEEAKYLKEKYIPWAKTFIHILLPLGPAIKVPNREGVKTPLGDIQETLRAYQKVVSELVKETGMKGYDDESLFRHKVQLVRKRAALEKDQIQKYFSKNRIEPISLSKIPEKTLKEIFERVHKLKLD